MRRDPPDPIPRDSTSAAVAPFCAVEEDEWANDADACMKRDGAWSLPRAGAIAALALPSAERGGTNPRACGFVRFAHGAAVLVMDTDVLLDGMPQAAVVDCKPGCE